MREETRKRVLEAGLRWWNRMSLEGSTVRLLILELGV